MHGLVKYAWQMVVSFAGIGGQDRSENAIGSPFYKFVIYVIDFMRAKEPLFDYINPKIDFQVRKGDCLNELKNIADNQFELIVTSPPYNVGK
jgi:hypothetical protein